MTIMEDAPLVADRATTPCTLRIASYPERNPGNPYIDLLYDAMRRHGFEHVGRLTVDPDWIAAQHNLDVVHIHWPERIWRGKRSGRLDQASALLTARSIRGVWRMCRFLERAGAQGISRVWTVHNVAHHEGANTVDRWGYRELARRCDLLVCFSESAARDIRQTFGPDVQVVITSHGSYKGAYTPSSSQGEARKRFGLRPDRPVVSCLGLLRPYKGIELACAATEILDGRVQLLVAGQPHKAFDVRALNAQSSRSAGAITVVARTLTAAEFADAVTASDAVVLPYRTVTGSGVLFAAWTLGAGVIASDLPFFREMLDERPLCGRTFENGDSSALARAIEGYLSVPVAERRRAISEIVERQAPIHAVEPLIEALRQRHPAPRRAADAV